MFYFVIFQKAGFIVETDICSMFTRFIRVCPSLPCPSIDIQVEVLEMSAHLWKIKNWKLPFTSKRIQIQMLPPPCLTMVLPNTRLILFVLMSEMYRSHAWTAKPITRKQQHGNMSFIQLGYLVESCRFPILCAGASLEFGRTGRSAASSAHRSNR